MSRSVMSEGLKRTLGIIEGDSPVVEIPVYSEDGKELISPPTRAFEITPFVPKDVPTTIPETENSDLRDDYIVSRNITHTLIEYAGSALQGALAVAIDSQHPKAFETFNQLATTMRGLSRDLIEMQKTYQAIQDANKERDKPVPTNITQNNININEGATNTQGSQSTTNTSLADVLKMLHTMTAKENKPVPGVHDIIDIEDDS